METAVIDGKVDIENGNVPEDKPSEQENDTISPFHVPGLCVHSQCFVMFLCVELFQV